MNVFGETINQLSSYFSVTTILHFTEIFPKKLYTADNTIKQILTL